MMPGNSKSLANVQLTLDQMANAIAIAIGWEVREAYEYAEENNMNNIAHLVDFVHSRVRALERALEQ